MDSAALAVKEGAALRPAVVVTGASSGIGLELARIAAREAPVVLIARSRDPLARLAGEIIAAGGAAHPLPLDLGAGSQVAAVENFLAEHGFYCDVLVNNAGFGLIGQADQLSRDEQLALIDLNIRALTDLTLAFLPGMMARGRGGVLNLSSIAGFLPGPHMAVYYASKAYARSFSEALWEECRRAGVTVSALCPGPVETGFFERAAGAAKKKPRLFELLPGDDARSVAEKGWRGFRAGRRIVIPGFGNKVVAAVAPVLPTRLVLWAVRKLQKSRAA